MSEVIIRPARAQELEQIRAYNRETYAQHARLHPYAFPLNGVDLVFADSFNTAFLDAEGQPVDESGNLFVADNRGEIVGYILVSWWARPDAAEFGRGSIDDIFVRPDVRGQGIGKALIQKAQELARARDWDNLEAQVFSGNTASDKLFAQMGFTPQAMIYRSGPLRQAREQTPEKPAQADDQGSKPFDWRGWAIAALGVLLLGLLLS